MKGIRQIIWRHQVLLFAALFIFTGLNARDNDSIPYFGLFSNDSLMEIILKFDISTYLRKKPKDTYLKAEMTLRNCHDSVTRQVKLRTRGKFRNSYCTYAPIELNLRKAGFGYSDLDSIKDLKLVTQCSNGPVQEDYILREYLVYRLFNILTDSSFRVRLLKIVYVDNGKERKTDVRYGFFLEPAELLAQRIGCTEVKTSLISQKNVYPRIMDRLAIFDYMIGDYDWSVAGKHNVEIFQPDAYSPGQLLVAVPYDFDWSGIVNPSYAVPPESMGIKTVRERVYRGICRDQETFRKDLIDFNSYKSRFYKEITDFTFIRRGEKNEIIDYLDEFFNELYGNMNKILNYLHNTCTHL